MSSNSGVPGLLLLMVLMVALCFRYKNGALGSRAIGIEILGSIVGMGSSNMDWDTLTVITNMRFSAKYEFIISNK